MRFAYNSLRELNKRSDIFVALVVRFVSSHTEVLLKPGELYTYTFIVYPYPLLRLRDKCIDYIEKTYILCMYKQFLWPKFNDFNGNAA